MTKIIKLLLLLMLPALSACHDSNAPEEDIDYTDSTRLSYSAACQTDTLRFKASGKWAVESCPDWITPVKSTGSGDIILPLYLEQNDGGIDRSGEIVIQYSGDSSLKLQINQVSSDLNGNYLDTLPETFGLGWGYDITTDIADISGVKGQIFNSAELRKEFGKSVIRYENNATTQIIYTKAESTESLQRQMGGKVEAGVDVKVASARVSVAFEQQINEQIDRLYVWCRDFRQIKSAYLADVDIYDPEVLERCTTSDFRNCVKNGTPAKIVKDYGTHLVKTSHLGGKLDYYFTVSSSVKETVEKMVTTINLKLLFFKKTATSVDEKLWTEIKKDFKGEFKVTGGGARGERLNQQLKEYASKGEPLLDQTLFDAWYSCFSNVSTAKQSDLAMVNFDVVPIWEIIEGLDEQKALQVKNYIKNMK